MFLLGLMPYLAVTPLPAPQNTQPPAPSENARTLNAVTSTGVKPDENAIRTGKLLIRPVLIAKDKRNAITATNKVVLVFKPIQDTDEGNVELYTDQEKEEYRITLTPPLAVSTETATRIQPKIRLRAFDTKAIDLPGGTYTLSEVHYHTGDPIAQQVNPIHPTIQVVSYCLSEGSFAFDIQNNQVGYLGAIGISDLPSNRIDRDEHTPLRALDQDPRKQNKRGVAKEAITSLSIDAINFTDRSDLCSATKYNVAGWKSAEKQT